MNLPFEIQLHIFRFLGLPAHQALKHVSRKAKKMVEQPNTQADLLQRYGFQNKPFDVAIYKDVFKALYYLHSGDPEKYQEAQKFLETLVPENVALACEILLRYHGIDYELPALKDAVQTKHAQFYKDLFNILALSYQQDSPRACAKMFLFMQKQDFIATDPRLAFVVLPKYLVRLYKLIPRSRSAQKFLQEDENGYIHVFFKNFHNLMRLSATLKDDLLRIEAQLFHAYLFHGIMPFKANEMLGGFPLKNLIISASAWLRMIELSPEEKKEFGILAREFQLKTKYLLGEGCAGILKTLTAAEIINVRFPATSVASLAVCENSAQIIQLLKEKKEFFAINKEEIVLISMFLLNDPKCIAQDGFITQVLELKETPEYKWRMGLIYGYFLEISCVRDLGLSLQDIKDINNALLSILLEPEKTTKQYRVDIKAIIELAKTRNGGTLKNLVIDRVNEFVNEEVKNEKVVNMQLLRR